MDLVHLFKVLLRKIWLIILVSFIAVVATAVFVWLEDGTYKSSAELATGITDESTLAMEGDEKGMNHFNTQNKFSNLIENMNSRQVISLLSYKLILHDMENNQPFRDVTKIREGYSDKTMEKAHKLFKEKLASMEILFSDNENDKFLLEMLKEMNYDFETLKKGLTIYRIPSTDYVRISFSSENPKLSAFVVNNLSEEFIRYYITKKGERSDYSVNFFSKLVEERKNELNEKVNKLKEFKSYNQVVNITKQSESVIDQIRDLEMKREEEKNRMVGLRQSIKNIESKLTGRELSLLEKEASRVNSKILTLKNKINELNEKYISSGNENSQLLDQLQSLRNQLQRQITNSANEDIVNPGIAKQELVSKKLNYEVELEMAQASISSINEQIEKLKSSISGFATKEAQISALEREISVSQDAYLNALDKLNEARYKSKSIGSSLQQTAFGQPADEPEPSNGLLKVAFAGFGSFGMVVFILMLKEYMDIRIKSPFLLKEYTGFNPLGYLNEIKVNYLSLDKLFNNKNKDENLVAYRELLRKLRYVIESSGAKLFLITSTKPGEGKSTIIYSLAYTLNLNHKKILMIDTNFKNNAITRNFKAKPVLDTNKVSLVHHDDGSFNEMDTAFDMISKTSYPNIDVVGCQGGNYTPSEMFGLINFRELLENWQHQYDYIFMEGPALNKYSDSNEMAQYVEQVIPVFSAQSSIGSADKESISFLHSLKNKVPGGILNKVNPEDID